MFQIILSIQFLILLLKSLDALKISFYATIHSVTEKIRFTLNFNIIIPMIILCFIWTIYFVHIKKSGFLIALIPLIITFYDLELGLLLTMTSTFLVGIIYMNNITSLLNHLLIVLSFFNAIGVIYFGLLAPFNIYTPFLDYVKTLYYVQNILAYSVPLFSTFFLFYWIINPFVKMSKMKIPKIQINVEPIDRIHILFILFSIGLSIYIGIYPYFTAINPKNLNIGVDYIQYYQKINDILGGSTTIMRGMGGSRMFFFQFFFMIKSFLSFDTQHTLRFMPIILNPLLVLATCFFSFQLTKNGSVSTISAFFIATSHIMTVGLYSFFLANNLALSLALISLGCIIKATKELNIYWLLCACGTGSLLVFTHPWTMVQYFSVVPIFYIYNYYIEKNKNNRAYLYALVYIFMIAASEILKVSFFNGYSGAAAFSDTLETLTTLGGFWYSNIFAFQILYGGFMSNWVLIFLATIGSIVLDTDNSNNNYLSIFIILTSVIFYFSDELTKSRLFYNIPLGVYSSITFYKIINNNQKNLAIFVVLNSLYYLFSSMYNIV